MPSHPEWGETQTMTVGVLIRSEKMMLTIVMGIIPTCKLHISLK